MRALIAGLGLLAGCHRVFDLQPASLEVCEAGDQTAMPLEADATLSGAVPHGNEGVLHLTATSSVLLRFTRTIDANSIDVTLRPVDLGCADACETCTSTPGPVTVYLVTSPWDEATVTQAERVPGVAWLAEDRVLLGLTAFAPDGTVRISVPPGGEEETVSLELFASGGTTVHVAAREPNVCVEERVEGPTAVGTCMLGTRCGNSIVEEDEECDDGNVLSGDTCSASCKAVACGNSVVEDGEECDGGTGCDSNCTTPRCGNRVVVAPEVCDDGNVTNGDGCDANCTLTTCGNGIQTSPEACDDGNTNNSDACSNTCTVNGCGNGMLEAGEVCDDGNTSNNDTCDANCTLPGCGNGVRVLPEQCDDGNKVSGDGCSAFCQNELDG